MTESRLAKILAEETPQFRRRPVGPARRRKRPAMVLLHKAAKHLVWVVPVLALGWWALTAPEFSVKTIEVRSAGMSQVWLEQRLGQFQDQNLVSLDLDAVRSEALQHPWIDAVLVRKELPDRLRVVVQEHHPRAFVRVGDDVLLVSVDGLVFSRQPATARILGVTKSSSDAGTPGAGTEPLEVIVDGGLALPVEQILGTRVARIAALFETLDELEKSAPEWSAELAAARVLGHGDFELILSGRRSSILISAESATQKAVLLETLRPQIAQHYEVESFDLRFQGRIVLHGASPKVVTAEPTAVIKSRGPEA